MSQKKNFFRAIETMVRLQAQTALRYTIEEGQELLKATTIQSKCPLRAILSKHGNCRDRTVISCRLEDCNTCALADTRLFVFAHDAQMEQWRLLE